MAWNGTGTFSRLYNWVTDRDAGIKIQAARVDAEDDGFAAGINACLAKNGENAATGNLNIGGFRLTNGGNATARTDFVTAAQQQDGGPLYALTTGTNTIAATLTPAITAYANGQVFRLKAGNTTTDVSTLNVNGVGALNTYYPDGTTRIAAGAIIQNNIYLWAYDSSLNSAAGGFICINPSRITGSFTITLTGMSGATTGTMNYSIGQDGKTVFVWAAVAITGTSNATTMTGTGIPSAIQPTTIKYLPIRLEDAGGGAGGSVIVTAASGTWTFGVSFGNNGGGFTNINIKGIHSNGPTISYTLD